MSRPRILYIDVPFELESGGDKNRSRFLWSVLSESFDVECLLVAGPSPAGSRPRFASIVPVRELRPQPAPWYQSDSIFRFAQAERDEFRQLLTKRGYAAVFLRFHSSWELAELALGQTNGPAVIVDLDMLSSRLVGLRWQQEPSLRNRWFLFERIKLDRFERRLLARPALVLFSNPVELADQRKRVENLQATLAVLPNVMPELAPPTDVKVEPVILFFGSLNSAANTDAFRFLVTDLLPYLEADLQRHGVKIHVVGKNPPAWMEKLLKDAGSDRVVLVGGVASMEQAIAQSRFVFLPLRVASGTRTRILEAAAVGRAVVTTALGAEGIEVGDDALIADEPEQLAAAVRTLLENPSRAEQLGQRLRERCQARYSAQRVARDLVQEVSRFLPAGKGGST